MIIRWKDNSKSIKAACYISDVFDKQKMFDWKKREKRLNHKEIRENLVKKFEVDE